MEDILFLIFIFRMNEPIEAGEKGVYLQDDDEEEDSTGNCHTESSQDHDTTSNLSYQINQYEKRGQEVATAPTHIHVLSLL